MDTTDRARFRPPHAASAAHGDDHDHQVIDLTRRPTRPLGPRSGVAEVFPGLDGPGPLAIAWRDRWWLLVLALCAATATYAVVSQTPPVFAAETAMAFPYSGSASALSGGSSDRSRSLRTEAERIRSVELLTEAARAISPDLDPAVLEAQVQAIPTEDADVLTVRATSNDPALAAAIANEVAAAYRRQVDERQLLSLEDLERQRQRLRSRIARQQKQLASQLQSSDDADPNADPSTAATRLALEASVSQLSDVQVRLDQATAQQESAFGRIQVLRPAEAPSRPLEPRPLRHAATMVVLVISAFVTARWWLADPDPPVARDAQTVETALGVPVIAELPQLPRSSSAAGVVRDGYPQVTEAYRLVGAMTPVRGSVLVTPAGTGASCPDLVLNVAAALNRDGYRTVIIDGGNHATRYKAPPEHDDTGLTDVSTGRVMLERALLVGASSANSGIALLPWGTGRSTTSRSSGSGLTSTIADLRALADLVLIDGPPLASSAEALSQAAAVDAILVSVTTDTQVAELTRLRARLAQIDRPVLGVILLSAGAPRRFRRRRHGAIEHVRWVPLRPSEAAR